MHDVLKDDGYLILGHSENLNNVSQQFKAVAPTTYVKKDNI